jgi:glyceraldehyde-3-phosphate dehydrogenase (NADP+)
VIVTPTAPIDLALQKCLTGAFSYSGQICIHTQRIYVERSIFDSFLEQFCTAASKLKIGHVLEPDTDISAMIDEENAIRVEAWINEAVSQGARIACGGKRHGSVVEPTVLTNTQSSMKVCGLEAFGPVVTIEPYDDFKQAVEQINNSPYGLQAGVFTNAIDEMNYAFEHVEAGGVIVNDVPTFRVDHMPYGGIKDSGFGREGVKYAIMEMMEPKIMVKPK